MSRSIFPLVNDLDRATFGRDGRDRDQVGYIDANTRAIFGRSYVGEPDALVKELAADEAIAAADTLLVTVPNTLGVDYNAHVVESILRYVAPDLGWRQSRPLSKCVTGRHRLTSLDDVIGQEVLRRVQNDLDLDEIRSGE